MDASAYRAAWERDGYFILPGLVTPEACAAMLAEADGMVRGRGDRVKAETFTRAGGAIIQRETNVGATAQAPEEFVSKIFSVHRDGLFRRIVADPAVLDVLGHLIGPAIDVFQSQLIYKNAGAIGQPWHQDSYYFDFTRQPQFGVWIALTEATLENGCLHVVPGSQHGPIHPHLPDRRPGANMGYLEIMDVAADRSVPVLMRPGDVLFFHSFLVHRSTDNVSAGRRAALVLHYAPTGTQQKPGVQNPVVDFMAVA